MNARSAQAVFLLSFLAMLFTVGYVGVILYSKIGAASVAVDYISWQNPVSETKNGTAAGSLLRNSTSTTAKSLRRRVRFIPFPHKTLGSGADMECQWETKSLDNNTEYDWVQRTIFAEGICIPPHLKVSLHVFSSAEAIECLSPIKLIVSGDSYTRQLFIGLADILLSRPLVEGKEFRYPEERNVAVESAIRLFSRHRQTDLSFPDVQFQCAPPSSSSAHCYGADAPFSDICSSCMNNYTENNVHTVGVVGAGVHIKRHFMRDVNSTVEEINKFLVQVKRSIFVSVPSYQMEKVAEAKVLDFRGMDDLYHALLPNLAPFDDNHPFLDTFQLTKSCIMDNCSSDGGHRSRYVNRWKAQLLLNTLCERDDGED